MDKKSTQIICTNFSNGKKHDFRLFKESRIYWNEEIRGVTDTGYTGIKKIRRNAVLPKRASKNHPLTKQEKEENRAISSERALNENVIGKLKRFKIMAERYRNRRRRFGLRFNLIAGIHNHEIG